MAANLNDHYAQLLGLDESWKVDEVDLDMEEKRVLIRLEASGSAPLRCPVCECECPRHDRAPERKWRHLDAMGFETALVARPPRCRCSEHGVKTVVVPWADGHSRFTLAFEGFAVLVLKACANTTSACSLMGISWDAAHRIMGRAVERGLERRDLSTLKRAGIDEKSFLRGQSYVSVLSDIDGGRVLEVVMDRDTEAAEGLLASIGAGAKDGPAIEAVAMDMWPAFMNAVSDMLPDAARVHDRFHIAKHLNEAVAQVRRAEHKALMAVGDDVLKGTAQMWNYSEDGMPDWRIPEFAKLREEGLKTGRAWQIKECLRHLWDLGMNREQGEAFFNEWYSWAVRSKLDPIRKKAKMIKRHLDGILNYFDHAITNAVAEGLNSKIQSLKSAARGFHNFANYRIRILFHCGKLDLTPHLSH